MRRIEKGVKLTVEEVEDTRRLLMKKEQTRTQSYHRRPVIPNVYCALPTHLDHFLRIWGVDTLVICGTVANICVHYTAASAGLRWYDVVIPRDATSALDPFDLESSLRQTDFLFAGRITESEAVKVKRA